MDFKAISQASPEYIKIVKAVGDSMQPTINDGDFVFVDISSQSMGSDGIYVLSGETGLSVKRLQNDYNGNVTIISDNKLYNARPIPMNDIHILGCRLFSNQQNFACRQKTIRRIVFFPPAVFLCLFKKNIIFFIS